MKSTFEEGGVLLGRPQQLWHNSNAASLKIWNLKHYSCGVLATLSDNSLFFQKLSNKSVNMSFRKWCCYLEFSFQQNVSILHTAGRTWLYLQVVLNLISSHSIITFNPRLLLFCNPCYRKPHTCGDKGCNFTTPWCYSDRSWALSEVQRTG